MFANHLKKGFFLSNMHKRIIIVQYAEFLEENWHLKNWLHYFSKCESALHYFSKCESALHYFSKCESALLFNFSKCKQALIFYSGCKPALIFYSSKYETVSNFCFKTISCFFIIFLIILNMFQMLFLIMYKTSRF